MNLLNQIINILNQRGIETEHISSNPITYCFTYLGYEFHIWWDSEAMNYDELNLEYRISMIELQYSKLDIKQYVHRADKIYKYVDIELNEDYISYSIYLTIDPNLFTIEMLIAELKRIIEVVEDIESDIESMIEDNF